MGVVAPIVTIGSIPEALLSRSDRSLQPAHPNVARGIVQWLKRRARSELETMYSGNITPEACCGKETSSPTKLSPATFWSIKLSD